MIQNPFQDAARAACALLLGLCCFLPPVLAAFPGALSVLLLLASVRSLAFSASLSFFGLLLWLLGLFLSGVFGPLFPSCCLFLWAVPDVSLLR